MSYAGIFTDKNNTDHPITSTLYGTCATAANEAAKVVVCTDFDTLLTGVTIRVKFSNGNTAANPTININSTGAKSVFRFGSTTPVGAGSWEAGAVVELTYDGTSFFMTNSDNIAAKQNVTDNTLQTTDKTVPGAINELKSGLTNLDNEVNGDATVYPYADVITINDAVPANLADCSVKVEPVQDLHGYDKPWVGGAGKNKLPLVLSTIKSINTDGTWTGNTYAVNGGTITVNTRDDDTVTDIAVSGTFTATTYFALTNFTFADGTNYVMNGAPNGSSFGTYFLSATVGADYGSGVNIAGDGSTNNVRIVIQSGSISTPVTFLPMIRLATETDSTFAPYTNICPISGHTEAVVSRNSKNLCEKTIRGYIDATNNKISINNDGETAIFYALKGKTYTLSASAKDRRTIAHISSDNVVDNMPLIEYTTVPTGVYTWTATWEGWTAWYFLSDASSEAENTIQIEFGETATPYEPYQGKTYTLALGDTIYGGTVRIDSNGNTVMDVDRASVDLGTLDYARQATGTSGKYRFNAALTNAKPVGSNSDKPNALCSEYDIVTPSNTYGCIDGVTVTTSGAVNIYVENFNDATAEDFKSAMDGVQFCYELATPTTIQLTPQQIQLLQGQNTLYASTGDISVTVNGVSGAIGSVQEQVNGLAGKIGENQIYSDTPVQIGTVGDKPLYRLFVTFETPISSVDNAYTSTGINSEDIELILRGDGINADGTYYGHLAFDPTFNDHQAIGVKGVANIKYAVIEYI